MGFGASGGRSRSSPGSSGNNPGQSPTRSRTRQDDSPHDALRRCTCAQAHVGQLLGLSDSARGRAGSQAQELRLGTHPGTEGGRGTHGADIADPQHHPAGRVGGSPGPLRERRLGDSPAHLQPCCERGSQQAPQTLRTHGGQEAVISMDRLLCPVHRNLEILPRVPTNRI